MRFVNLTPHAIVIIADGRSIDIPPSGTVARVETETTTAWSVLVEPAPPLWLRAVEVPCQLKKVGKVVGLPGYNADPDAVYLVSGMVLGALRESGASRDDVAAPATGPDDGVIRDVDGRVAAVTRLDVLR